MHSTHLNQHIGNVEPVIDVPLSHNQLVMEQKKDHEIIPLFDNLISVENMKKDNTGYFIEDNILMRRWKIFHIPDTEDWAVVHQVAVPKFYQPEIVGNACKILMDSHLRINKTCDKLLRYAFTP